VAGWRLSGRDDAPIPAGCGTDDAMTDSMPGPHIAPSPPSAGPDLRGLLWTLVRTDFKTRYHGTVGGYVWAMVKPAVMFIVLLGVFSLIFSMDPDYPINLIIGLFVWDFFAEATRSGMGALHAKSFLLTKASFPRWVLVLTSSSNALITVTLFSVVVTLYLAIGRQTLTPIHFLLFLGYLLLFLCIIIGFSLAASVLYPVLSRPQTSCGICACRQVFSSRPIIYPLEIIRRGSTSTCICGRRPR
jgi:ABC-2 type transport system permease protein